MKTILFFSTIILISVSSLFSGRRECRSSHRTIRKTYETTICSGIPFNQVYKHLQNQNYHETKVNLSDEDLFDAVKSQEYGVIRDYLNTKPKDVVTDEENSTLLHAAVISDDMTMVNLFLNFSAHIFEMMHHINFSLQTPFDIAQSNGSIEVLNAMKIRYDRYVSTQRMHSQGYLPPSQRPKKRKRRTKI